MKPRLSLTLFGTVLLSRVNAGSDETFQLLTSQLQNIQMRTENLTNAIYNWNEGNSDNPLEQLSAIDNIHWPSADLVTYATNATEALLKVPTTFDLTQAFRIASPVQRFAYAANHSVAALNSRHSVFVKLGSSPVVIVNSDLQDLRSATQNFSQVLISYIPKNLQPVAYALERQVINSINMGLACYAQNDSLIPACSTAAVNPNITFELAVKYGAIKPNGFPIA